VLIHSVVILNCGCVCCRGVNLVGLHQGEREQGSAHALGKPPLQRCEGEENLEKLLLTQ